MLNSFLNNLPIFSIIIKYIFLHLLFMLSIFAYKIVNYIYYYCLYHSINIIFFHFFRILFYFPYLYFYK